MVRVVGLEPTNSGITTHGLNHLAPATPKRTGAGYQNRTDDGRLEIYSFAIKLIPQSEDSFKSSAIITLLRNGHP